MSRDMRRVERVILKDSLTKLYFYIPNGTQTIKEKIDTGLKLCDTFKIEEGVPDRL